MGSQAYFAALSGTQGVVLGRHSSHPWLSRCFKRGWDCGVVKQVYNNINSNNTLKLVKPPWIYPDFIFRALTFCGFHFGGSSHLGKPSLPPGHRTGKDTFSRTSDSPHGVLLFMSCVISPVLCLLTLPLESRLLEEIETSLVVEDLVWQSFPVS